MGILRDENGRSRCQAAARVFFAEMTILCGVGSRHSLLCAYAFLPLHGARGSCWRRPCWALAATPTALPKPKPPRSLPPRSPIHCPPPAHDSLTWHRARPVPTILLGQPSPDGYQCADVPANQKAVLVGIRLHQRPARRGPARHRDGAAGAGRRSRSGKRLWKGWRSY